MFAELTLARKILNDEEELDDQDAFQCGIKHWTDPSGARAVCPRLHIAKMFFWALAIGTLFPGGEQNFHAFIVIRLLTEVGAQRFG